MSTSAFALLILACGLFQAESACMCPSSNPGCEDDGKCYKRSGHSYSWRSLSCGSCTSSHESASHVLKNSGTHQGKCFSYYGSGGDWCYTQKSGGDFATSGCSSYNGYGTDWCCPNKYRCEEASPAPAPAASSSLTLKHSAKEGSTGRCYSYFGDHDDWCYTKTSKTGNSFATSGCASYDGYKTNWCCKDKTECDEPSSSSSSSSSGGGCNPTAMQKYIANFVKGKAGSKVYSDKQGSAQCWDLAWAAMEQAEKHGYHPEFYQKTSGWKDSYVWSSVSVPIEEAQPGDVAQFGDGGWKEPMRYTWDPHTAVVTECYSDGTLTTHDQNPSPVHEAKYHPHEKTSGSVTIYRLQEKSRLRLYSEMPQPSLLELHSGQLSVLAGVCAVAGLLAAASFIVKRRSGARSEPSTSEVETFLPLSNIEA